VAHPRASGEITCFRNDIGNFVFRSPLSLEEFEERLPEFRARFPERDIDVEDLEFPIIENVAADSVLQGVEVHSDFGLTSNLFAEVLFDYVRGTVKDTDEPLPRIPPLRSQFGLRYQYNAFQFGGNVTAVAKQDRVFGEKRRPTATPCCGCLPRIRRWPGGQCIQLPPVSRT
jgi:TonB dependent receptor